MISMRKLYVKIKYYPIKFKSVIIVYFCDSELNFWDFELNACSSVEKNTKSNVINENRLRLDNK